MPAAYGPTAAGFVVKPLSAILGDMQQAVWSAPSIGPDLDLSSQTPDGQMLAIVADPIAQNWEMLQVVYNQYNREDAEGAALDNLGDVVGVPREGETYTQVYCVCTLDPAHAPYGAGTLVDNVAGFPAQTFTNLAAVSSTDITNAGGTPTVLFQSTTIGPTPAVNPGTLTAITTPVTGWSAVTNPAGQSQLGQAEETDAAYGPRQSSELAVEGACNPSATVAAIEALGASQTPPVTLTATVYENTTTAPVTIGGLTLQPSQFAVFVYDNGTGWLTSAPGFAANQQLVGQTIWNNRPSGNLAIGSIGVTIQDPILGQQSIAFSVPTGAPLFINATVAIRAGQVFASVVANIRTALVAAAVAPTPSSGIPPAGQLTPGAYVIGSQLEAIIMGVPGVLDVQALTFALAPFPTNKSPITIPINEVATILQGTAGSHISIAQGGGP